MKLMNRKAAKDGKKPRTFFLPLAFPLFPAFLFKSKP